MFQKEIENAVVLVGDEMKKSDNAWLSLRKKRQRIDLKTDGHILFLEKGTVSVYRVENDLVTVSISAPAILGLPQMRTEVAGHYLRCDTDCEMWAMSVQNADLLFTAKNLWKQAFYILTHHLQRYFQREALQSHRTIREQIIEHVKYIWAMEPGVREKTSVYTFILARNHISRSAIHKVLQELVNDGKIIMNRGKLSLFIY
ncbi:helix-turn-helix domain-containing protein [Citrobacter freundii]|uniref:helix-turn-helix domain-containing protein n=1 Tax=Citrobacter freundii TaxID=546 RepID=UPI00157501FA|nr:helix-turn-helix domain-containing protein [Citrobacter freundii]EKA2133178.1 helix-turn-helix domain-containing protein [Citrobacter freundii]ELT7644469.1 helix-turn-helix domain-containing protein [Citrobacter freundii]EMB4339044.1 helix-turn-helix domain-containing protein [Citrobacter freundii]MBJ9042529.1 helix-turn-helix domain-containing protein [Citrobacter freundii]MDV1265975.1 helix-turn-helix domain-containing protein [Citrobacter freundii]